MTNIIFYGHSLKVFFLRSETREEFSLSQLLSNLILEVLTIETRQGNKGIQIGNEGVKLSLFTGDMVPYIDNIKDATQKLREICGNRKGRTSGVV